MSRAGQELAVCVDVGSTWTKAALVDTGRGTLLARAQHRTPLPGQGHTDLLEGLDACVAQLAEAHAAARDAELRACSSAGGGLRIGVVGNEELVTAEAGRRVALSSGGRVVAVVAGGARRGGSVPDLAPLAASDPDVVLLVGGTDGGDSEVLLRCARALSGRPWPVVAAGNREAAAEVAALLSVAGTPCTTTANVLPRIGVLEPEPARRAVRAVFLDHVIGGLELSSGSRFRELVRGATPDVVLTGWRARAPGRRVVRQRHSLGRWSAEPAARRPGSAGRAAAGQVRAATVPAVRAAACWDACATGRTRIPRS